MHSSLLPLDGLRLFLTPVFRDSRGFFFEAHSDAAFHAAGLTEPFVQDNVSVSRRGVVRGLHFQSPPHAQGKLVRVLHGTVFDVAVDLRRGSPTCGRWHAETLSAGDGRALYLPPGFAHGFCCLSETAVFFYKCTAPYHPAAEAGLAWNDPDVNIAWPVPAGDAIISEKDRALPRLESLISPF